MIEIVSGTNRANSNSIIVAGIYSNILSDEGAENNIIDLKNLPKDYISSALYEESGKNEKFNILAQRMLEAKKFIFIVPEYNGSFPGVLKAFIDGLKFPFTLREKKAALIGLSSGSQGGSLAVSHMTDILNYCGTHVLAQKPRLSNIESYISNGEISNNLYMALIREQIREFIKF